MSVKIGNREVTEKELILHEQQLKDYREKGIVSAKPEPEELNFDNINNRKTPKK